MTQLKADEAQQTKPAGELAYGDLVHLASLDRNWSGVREVRHVEPCVDPSYCVVVVAGAATFNVPSNRQVRMVTAADRANAAAAEHRDQVATHLRYLADLIVTEKLPVGQVSFGAGALDTRAELEQWAKALGGADIIWGGTDHNIPVIRHSLPGGFSVHAQSMAEPKPAPLWPASGPPAECSDHTDCQYIAGKHVTIAAAGEPLMPIKPLTDKALTGGES